MEKTVEYFFTIDALSPETLPMFRLSEYLADLSKLIGEERSVHFRRLDKGSAVIVHWVEQDAAPRVRQRVGLARNGVGPLEPLRAIERINEKLEEDGASGVLTESGAEIIRFPGHKIADDILVGPITQHTNLQGVVIRIGERKIRFQCISQWRARMFKRGASHRARWPSSWPNTFLGPSCVLKAPAHGSGSRAGSGFSAA